ncbi:MULTISPECIES: DUF2971 domain-containing protein [Bradyrhizobium]|uniref:DUF2971 domain-containing protein n=1 Tax=Bradyrhizobium elkanii TaxID=29448 RepID=UPI000409BE1D|nr:DUF2971 domain-containing protein [Bradyrhizobium elkanii]
MIEHLYRFRPLYWLLEKGELENQEIYFAKPEQLNDPMEGFRDIFWKGDAIVWRSFFRHYILCLDNAFGQLLLCGEQHPLGWEHIPVFNHGNINDGAPHKTLEEEVVEAFFVEPCVAALIDALAARVHPIRRDELAAHLRSVHMLALHLIREAYSRKGLQPESPDSAALATKFRQAISLTTQSIVKFQEVEKQHPFTEHQVDAFYIARRQLVSQLDFIHYYNGTIDFEQSNRNFVFLTFPDEFAQRVETLVYPEWYTACFMRDCRNSSVWGNYAINHTAVCLKFRVSELGGKPVLPLRQPYAINAEGILYDFRPLEFREITYESQHLPVDFFRSLGRFPIPVLRRHWYSDGAGNRSPCGDDIFRADEAWLARYWDSFYHAITRKLKDWQYEEEYRLVIDNQHWDFREVPARKLAYRFEDLDAIIFGMKTPMKEKLEICKIIEKKCRKVGRKDFKFYQAYYARSTGTIEHAELTSLKFTE